MEVTPISSAADGTQIWKITHNGVDTHPIHFHLYDVQILNRVTWDNIIIPPDRTELGWKDTIRVSPLEDTIVALRPIIPTLPFELPNSIRTAEPDDAGGFDARVQQRRRQRDPHQPDPEHAGELRLGVRLPLPHPQPRGDGHDAAGLGGPAPDRADPEPHRARLGTGGDAELDRQLADRDPVPGPADGPGRTLGHPGDGESGRSTSPTPPARP